MWGGMFQRFTEMELKMEIVQGQITDMNEEGTRM